MNFINQVFKPYLDHFVVVFINDILMYLMDKEEQYKHLWIVLKK